MINPTRITHVITDLATGGAERMLAQLLCAQPAQMVVTSVISLTSGGSVAEEIQDMGIRVRSLGMRPGKPNPFSCFRLSRWLREEKSDLVQTWMYHADLVGGMAARLAGNIPVVWGIHNYSLDSAHVKKSTILTVRLNAVLSRWLPAKIISVSRAACQVHEQLGYDYKKMVIIPNGIDLGKFHPDLKSHQDVRVELEIRDKSYLVGLIARFDPLKDHHNFIQAADKMLTQNPDINFLLCGEGITWQNPVLAGWIESTRLPSHFHLLGLRQDIPRLLSALDLAVLSSIGEAFPIIICEAMACGVPCVVTDTGDSALLVGDTGKVIPPRDSQKLADACLEMLSLPFIDRQNLGRAARRRIEENFEIHTIADRYADLYRNILEKDSHEMGH